MAQELKFGFRPSPLDLTAGAISIETLDDLDDRVAEVERSGQVFQDWIYAPLQPIKTFENAETYQAPNAARVFGLPNTHIVRHIENAERAHLQFHIWSLGFFTGQRLSATEAGFLDVTTLKPGKLNDFVLLGDSLPKSVHLAEAYWQNNVHSRTQIARFEAAIHALFLAQNPRLLQFEEFIFLYVALDACFAMMKEVSHGPHIIHKKRTSWMCEYYGIPVPDWADTASGPEITDLRNPTFHEGLYMGEPLGFAIEGRGASRSLNLQLEALICRLLVAIIGGDDTEYVKSTVTSRQIIGLTLS